MRQLFLYKVFQYSKIWFVFIVVFLVCYSILFYKKMDTVFFPYNNMFAIDFTKDNSSSVIRLRLDGIPVKISDKPYWKKDFLEESLINYTRYKKQGDEVFMEKYLRQTIHKEAARNFLIERLCPDKKTAATWLRWYLQFAGYEIQSYSEAELIQYNLNFEGHKLVIKDSVSILKTTLF